MKRLAVLIAASLAVGATLILRAPAANVPETPKPATGPASDRLVVHEWGTFTTFSGSDGVRMEFRPLVVNDLPDFVLDRAMQSGQWHPFAKARIRAGVRMETPVTYFYTDRERDVKVRVAFPQGLLTEFYPPVAKMEPPFSWASAMNGEKIQPSLLDWGKVHLIPTDRLKTGIENEAVAARVQERLYNALVPYAHASNHYVHARETDSALVHVDFPPNEKEPQRPAGSYFEKFLFYRGVGKFDLPLKLESTSETEFRLTNSGAETVRSLFLVTVRGETLRFQQWDALKPAASMTLQAPSTSGTLDDLSAAVEASLVREGLYEKEARAMVKTWSSSWFGEQGTRLFYVVPRAMTDSVLPLAVEPSPDETVRVLVGRMEILSKEDEARMIEVVRRSAQLRTDFATVQSKASEEGKEVPKYPLPEELEELGRLAEPALVRLKTISKDETVRFEADALLRELTAALPPAQ